MEKKLKKYINDNAWIKNSETYENGVYKNYKPETIPMINLNNLKLQKLIKFLNFWNLYEPYPIKIYIFIDALPKEDKKSFLENTEIKNNHLKELIKLGIINFSINIFIRK